MKRRSLGFTLVEVMIVVAIIGILAAIAYPSYMEQIRKSRRADAQGALVSFANAMERYYTRNNTYVGSAGAGGVPTIFSAQVPVSGGTAYYNLTVSAVGATSYTLSATPTGVQSGDSCGTLSLTSTGGRTPTTAGCW